MSTGGLILHLAGTLTVFTYWSVYMYCSISGCSWLLLKVRGINKENEISVVSVVYGSIGSWEPLSCPHLILSVVFLLSGTFGMVYSYFNRIIYFSQFQYVYSGTILDMMKSTIKCIKMQCLLCKRYQYVCMQFVNSVHSNS